MGHYDVRGKIALITGASSGIGKELSKNFAQAGADCILAAHPIEEAILTAWAEEVRERYGVRTWTVVEDLVTEDGPRRLFDVARAQVDRIDVLVNCAGLLQFGDLIESDLAQCDRMISLNVRAYALLMGMALPEMIERGDGRILNVSSVAAFQPTAHHAAYGATKAFVQFMSEAVRQEVKGSGVKVCTLNPPYTKTGLLGEMPENLRWFRLMGLADPAIVARGGFEAFLRGKPMYIWGWRHRFFHLVLTRLGSRRMNAWVPYMALKAPGAP